MADDLFDPFDPRREVYETKRFKDLTWQTDVPASKPFASQINDPGRLQSIVLFFLGVYVVLVALTVLMVSVKLTYLAAVARRLSSASAGRSTRPRPPAYPTRSRDMRDNPNVLHRCN